MPVDVEEPEDLKEVKYIESVRVIEVVLLVDGLDGEQKDGQSDEKSFDDLQGPSRVLESAVEAAEHGPRSTRPETEPVLTGEVDGDEPLVPEEEDEGPGVEGLVVGEGARY